MDNTQSSNDREFLGITQNECTFQGKVVGDPVIQNDNYAFLQLKTTISEVGANGQWADVVVQIPIITMDPKKVAVIQKYVQDGRAVGVPRPGGTQESKGSTGDFRCERAWP